MTERCPRQVEGLVTFTGRAGSIPVSGTAESLDYSGLFAFPDGEGTIQVGIAARTSDAPPSCPLVPCGEKRLVLHA
jgi:hypothetical protein